MKYSKKQSIKKQTVIKKKNISSKKKRKKRNCKKKTVFKGGEQEGDIIQIELTSNDGMEIVNVYKNRSIIDQIAEHYNCSKKHIIPKYGDDNIEDKNETFSNHGIEDGGRLLVQFDRTVKVNFDVIFEESDRNNQDNLEISVLPNDNVFTKTAELLGTRIKKIIFKGEIISRNTTYDSMYSGNMFWRGIKAKYFTNDTQLLKYIVVAE